LLDSTKIWEACRATSAATTFFDPITIGPFDEEFVDGALGANNPIYELWTQAQDIWGDQLWGRLKCLVSIGTGIPKKEPVRDDLLGIWASSEPIRRTRLKSSAATSRSWTMKDATTALMSTTDSSRESGWKSPRIRILLRH
jgi:predicted acylesterase/phospholipase RssA